MLGKVEESFFVNAIFLNGEDRKLTISVNANLHWYFIELKNQYGRHNRGLGYVK